jgi:hypothetical protein
MLFKFERHVAPNDPQIGGRRRTDLEKRGDDRSHPPHLMPARPAKVSTSANSSVAVPRHPRPPPRCRGGHNSLLRRELVKSVYPRDDDRRRYELQDDPRLAVRRLAKRKCNEITRCYGKIGARQANISASWLAG